MPAPQQARGARTGDGTLEPKPCGPETGEAAGADGGWQPEGSCLEGEALIGLEVLADLAVQENLERLTLELLMPPPPEAGADGRGPPRAPP